MSSEKQVLDLFSGNIQKDSPSAHISILRYLGKSSLNQLSIAYEQVAASGNLERPYIIRTPHVRFNPLPARLIHILLIEAGCRDPSIIEMAIRSVNDGTINLNLLSILDPNCYREKPYLTAILLDELRHLHMQSKIDQSEASKHLLPIKILSRSDAFSYWPRLGDLVIAALKRISKNLPETKE